MAALICGSIAYDTIMVFPERFRDHILPDQVHILNVAFTVPRMRREFGGVAGNISYNLKLLGGDPYPMGTVGQDFRPYREHLDQLGISRRYVRELEDQFTPQAFITTDIDDNQITAFHPGAMGESHLNHVRDAEGISIGIVAPDNPVAMRQHSVEFVECGIPHFFDPGQAMTLFKGDEMREFIERADWVIVNDYECQYVQEVTGWSKDDITARTNAFIVTLGGKGSDIYTTDGVQHIEPVPPEKVQDPTGCGDAYRAGVMHGLLHDMDLPTACRIGSVMGSLKIAHPSPQNHTLARGELDEKFRETYGYSL